MTGLANAHAEQIDPGKPFETAGEQVEATLEKAMAREYDTSKYLHLPRIGTARHVIDSLDYILANRSMTRHQKIAELREIARSAKRMADGLERNT